MAKFEDDFEDGFDDDFGSSGFDDDEFGSSGFDSEDTNLDSEDSLFDKDELIMEDDIEVETLGETSDDEEEPEYSEDSTALKKTAIVAIIAGAVILIIIGIIIRIKSGSDNKANNIPEETEITVSKDEAGKEVEMSDGDNSDANNSGVDTENGGNESVTISQSNEDSGYIEIEPDDTIEELSTNEGTFTITDIKFYAKKADQIGSVSVITRLKGSISGLSGTFEIEIPYSKGLAVSVGNVFKITYKLGDKNGNKVIYDIEY